MLHATRKTLALLGVMASAGAGGAAIAGAAGDSGADRAGSDRRSDEKPLTGDTAEKVKSAAIARVEGGTIVRVETDADHGSPYEAHVRRSDGTEVEVLVNEDFEVTAVNEMAGDHGRGFGGPAPGLGALARELGVSRARLRAALETVRPDGPPDKGSLAADLAKALGVEESDVQAILDANRTAGPHGPGGHTDLVAALADGLNIDEAKVEAALDKLHDDRHAEFAAALAKRLGLSADRVEQALEATRPEPPPGRRPGP